MRWILIGLFIIVSFTIEGLYAQEEGKPLLECRVNLAEQCSPECLEKFGNYTKEWLRCFNACLDDKIDECPPLPPYELDFAPDPSISESSEQEREGMTADAAKALDEFLEQVYSSPLKQVRVYGVEPYKVSCALDLNLVFKKTNGSPACVKAETAAKLIQRGWIGKVDPTWTEGCWPSISENGKNEFYLYYSKHGGIAGIFESVSVNATEKTITIRELNNKTNITKIDDDELEKLWNLISEGDFFDLEKKWHPPSSGSADYMTHLLTACSGYINNRVAWADSSEEPIPDIVIKIVERMNLHNPLVD